MIKVTAIKVKTITLDKEKDGNVKISGSYEILTEKGITLANQTFNGYSDMKMDFDSATLKNFVSEVEERIEIKIGINEAVKEMKG